ncbi:MAG: HD domain-containing protein [bacterium]|nr:HD domain-containing protein [bacterium]
MKQNELASKLGNLFTKHNHELFLVGGAIRDTLLDKTPDELDFATNAKPEEIKSILKQAKPTNTYTIGEKFGTIGAFFGTCKIEITTYRSEAYLAGDRHPEVTFGKSLQEDLSRRDFTINSIAYNPITKEYVDPYNGKGDLAKKIIRVVGDTSAPHPSKKGDGGADRFREDPLRILRAIRFAVVLKFEIDDKTLEYVKSTAPEIASISVERIAQELDKILTSETPSHAIQLLSETKLLDYILPEFIALQTVQHEANEHKNIYQHTLTVLDNVPPTKQLRWLALLHDIAKPQTKTTQNNEVHFLHHETVGSKMAKNILQRLHYDNQFTNNITKLIKLHLRVNLYQPTWTDGAVKRLMLEAGDLLDDLITFSYADITSARQYKVDQGHKRIDEFKKRAEEVRKQEELEKIKSPLSGDELMELFNKPAGPWIKPIKEHLLDLVIDGKMTQDDKETAKKIALDLIQKK